MNHPCNIDTTVAPRKHLYILVANVELTSSVAVLHFGSQRAIA